MNGIIDVGGGMRGAYTAGIYDYFIDHNIQFDYCIGISAGSANMCNYLSGQRGRNILSYTVYSKEPEYMGVGNFIRTGSYVNMDYIYSTLCNSGAENPFDYKKFSENKSEFFVGATDAVTGKAYYFTKSDIKQDYYDILKASCSLPAVNKPYFIKGKPYYDGGISEPVPYKKAFADGCDKLVIALTRPRDFRRSPLKNQWLMKLMLKKYPKTYSALLKRHIKYNRALDELEKMKDRVLIIAPDDINGMSTLRNNVPAMKRLYKMGYNHAVKIEQFLK